MSGATVELRNVSLTYDERPILDDISLALDEGELIVVSGPTGSGKSSLLGVVTGLVPRFTGGRLSGDVLVDGHSVIEKSARERVHVVASVGQDPAAGFVTDTVEEELAFGMEQLGLTPTTMRRRVEETLDLLGIADLRDRDLRTLSGGQQQRVAIGSVLTMHPRVLVLDEPTSALDPTAAEDVLATVTRLVHDLGLTVLLAEHRLERVVPFADRMVLIAGDGSVRVGAPAEVLEHSEVVPPIVELGRVAGWRPLPLTVRAARRHVAELAPRLADPVAARPPGPGTPRVEIDRLTIAYGATVAVRDVTAVASGGAVTVLMGRNGSGKSSLLWAVQGTGPARGKRSGSARVDGADPARWTPDERRTRVGLVPQNAADLLYLDTVSAECAAADAAAGRESGVTRGLLDGLVDGVETQAHPRDLSEGQRLALVLAIVLAHRPGVLLLDEPTRGLDYTAKRSLAASVRALAQDGHAVVVSTHDVEFAAAVADQIWVLAEGELVSRGPVLDVLAESPAFAPQVTKILGLPWLRVDQVATALDRAPVLDSGGCA